VAAPRAAPEVHLGEEAARFGSLVHRLLALPDPIDDGALEEAAAALRAEHGLGSEDAREAAALAKATRSLPAVAAAREADLVYREQPFTCVLDGERVAGRFDLAYRKDGRWTLVDFKTARLSGPAEARARYGPQLDRYRRALAALTSEPVDSALCLVRDGQLVAA
ncbi:MAG TPA: PD-(D/E)XK nuclease family protein, partial [Vicinamibacteria bacterium]